MKLRTLQWNIRAGYIRNEGSDPKDNSAYSRQNIDYIIGQITSLNPDIVTLQETHSNEVDVQVQDIAEKLFTPYFCNDVNDDSHINSDLAQEQKLCQSIISRFPITNHRYERFTNPGLTFELEGKTVKIHNKGVTSCSVRINEQTLLEVKTAHLFPLRKCGIDPLDPRTETVRQELEKLALPADGPYLFQADFNLDDIVAFAPGLFENGVQEVPLPQSTTPRGRFYDKVLYKGMQLVSVSVLSDALTDHYPVVCDFELL